MKSVIDSVLSITGKKEAVNAVIAKYVQDGTLICHSVIPVPEDDATCVAQIKKQKAKIPKHLENSPPNYKWRVAFWGCSNVLETENDKNIETTEVGDGNVSVKIEIESFWGMPEAVYKQIQANEKDVQIEWSLGRRLKQKPARSAGSADKSFINNCKSFN